MRSKTPLSLLALLLLAAVACSDDEKPPITRDGLPPGGDGSVKKDNGAKKDTLDPKCPMPGPCVLK
jgi:hypothetical protein